MAKAANGTLPSMPEKQPRFMDRFSKATKVGFVLLGYFLGIIGVLIDWAIGHKKKMMECSAEAIWYGLIGWGASMITRFALLALGINKTDYLLQLFGPGVTVWNILWCICGACFIVLSMLWIYGLRTKMTDAERAYNLKGDDHFHNGEKTLRYDGGITVTLCPKRYGPTCNRQANQRVVGTALSAWNACSPSTSAIITTGRNTLSGRTSMLVSFSGFTRHRFLSANG